MELTRRGFIGGIGAFAGLGLIGGGRLFAAPSGWEHQKPPRLIVGMVADTHVRTGANGKRMDSNRPTTWFIKALEHFREIGADAVVHLGDMAHCGQTQELVFHREAWEKVFGATSKVARIFVTGNHEICGSGDFVERFSSSPEEVARRLFRTDVAANWEKAFGEKYEPVRDITVKGYHFVVREHLTPEADLERFMEENAAKIAPSRSTKPVFLLSHVPPGEAHSAAMSRWKQCVGFYGHCHASAANWNVIGCKPGEIPYVQCPALRAMPHNVMANDKYAAKYKGFSGREAAGCNTARQGFVIRVYDDCLAIERREFTEGGKIGEDWVLALGKYAPSPFEKAELKKAIGEPQFRKGAKLEVENVANVEILPNANIQSQLETGNIGIGNTGNIGNIVVKIPLADGNPDTRAYGFDVAVSGEGGAKRYRSVYACGCNMGIGHEANGGITTVVFEAAQLPPGDELTIAARPVTSLGSCGSAIAVKYDMKKKEVVQCIA